MDALILIFMIRAPAQAAAEERGTAQAVLSRGFVRFNNLMI